MRKSMRYRDAARAVIALSLAALFIKTGATKLPVGATLSNVVGSVLSPPVPDTGPLRHAPVFVYSEPMLTPLIVRAKQIKQLVKRRGPFDRAPFGEKIRVSVTQYCLQGTTRRSNPVRLGIVAADPRVFPLAHYVEVFLGGRHLGKFLVDDTGGAVKGATLDIWNPSCSEARRFGRQWGSARLVVK